MNRVYIYIYGKKLAHNITYDNAYDIITSRLKCSIERIRAVSYDIIKVTIIFSINVISEKRFFLDKHFFISKIFKILLTSSSK